MAFGASAFPSQYFAEILFIHMPTLPTPCSHHKMFAQCLAPPYDDSQPSCFGGFQRVKPRSEHTCPLPQDTKAVFKVCKCLGVVGHFSI